MNRVFTHLRLPTGPSTMTKSVFFENPDFPTLVDGKQSNKTPKVLAQRARGSRETLFSSSFLFIYFIYFINFINSIQFSLLTSLTDARTRRLPESTARSGRARDLSRLTRPLCDCAIHTYYVLARPRTTSTDAPRNPSMLVPSQQKNQTNQKNQKNERKSLWTLAVTSQCRI